MNGRNARWPERQHKKLWDACFELEGRGLNKKTADKWYAFLTTINDHDSLKKNKYNDFMNRGIEINISKKNKHM